MSWKVFPSGISTISSWVAASTHCKLAVAASVSLMVTQIDIIIICEYQCSHLDAFPWNGVVGHISMCKGSMQTVYKLMSENHAFSRYGERGY